MTPAIPFNLAVLCVGCSHITESCGTICDHCGESGGLLNLSSTLDRSHQIETEATHGMV